MAYSYATGRVQCHRMRTVVRKEPATADKWWPSNLRDTWGASNASPINNNMTWNVTQGPEMCQWLSLGRALRVAYQAEGYSTSPSYWWMMTAEPVILRDPCWVRANSLHILRFFLASWSIFSRLSANTVTEVANASVQFPMNSGLRIRHSSQPQILTSAYEGVSWNNPHNSSQSGTPQTQ